MTTRELRMSDNLQPAGPEPKWAEARQRLTGKWQIPALALALVAFGVSIATYRTPVAKIPFDDLLKQLPVLVDEGMYTSAIGVAEQLFLAPRKTPQDLAPVHANLGRARLLRAERAGARVASVGRAVIEHYAFAVDGGFELTTGDRVLLGKAHEWNRDFRTAIAHYDAAIKRQSPADVGLRWRAARLRMEYGRQSAADTHAELNTLIAEASNRPEIVAWAVEHELDLLCDERQGDAARALLERTRPLFGDGAWPRWHEYLEAYTIHRVGDADDAEMRVRHLRERLGPRDELFARTGWLLGRLVLGRDAQGRPLEAISFLKDVVVSAVSPVYSAAANLGMAEALVTLERFDEASDRYGDVIESVRRLPPSRHLNPHVIEASLTVVSERLRREGRTEAALGFARLAVAVRESGDATRRAMLLERLSDLQALVARSRRAEADADPAGGDDPTERLRAEARSLLLESSDAVQRIAEMGSLPEGRRSTAAWAAADRVHESGDLELIIEAMDRFIQFRPSSPYVARALRYRGQAQQLLNRFDEAVETYREALRRFARTPDAGSSLIPLARCYLAMGKDYADAAEKTLRTILKDSDVFTPSAPEYADALFLIGDLLNRNGAFERAIPALEEAMERYPDDERAVRARFLLGDCYRQSGLALKEDYEKATFAAERERIAVEQKNRLRKAAELFAQTIADFESSRAGESSAQDEIYLRHARLYQADCHFELGEYEDALAQYERAAWIYKGTTTALAAYIQIVNCHVFQGDGAEAAAAVRRALYLVETMPEETFSDGIGRESRLDWREYFNWVQQSELF